MNRCKDATELAQVIKRGDITPLQAVEEAYRQIEEYDCYHAVHTLNKDRALEQAQNLEDLSAPFAGVPILLKDLGQAFEGGLDSSGSALLKDNYFLATNHFVKKILDAGFIILGQTNVPEFGIKFISDSKYFGTVANPINPVYHAGGSSGGSAAAVQAGMLALAGASDGGGSIRIPASFTGLIGLKPSSGRMPTGPQSWRSWGGGATNFVLTQTMRDTEALFMALQSYEYEAMPYRLPEISQEQLDQAHQEVRHLRLAYVIRPDYDGPEAVRAIKQTIDSLLGLGFELEQVDLDLDIEALHESYYSMNGAEIDKIFCNIETSRGREIERDEVEIITWALREYGKKIPARDYLSNFDLWDKSSSLMSDLFENYDILIQATTTNHAPALDELVYDEGIFSQVEDYERLSQEDMRVMIAEAFKKANQLSPYALIDNLTGIPAISLPLYTCENGLPLGIQLSAAKGREDRLLALATYIEDASLFKSYQPR